MSKTKKNEMPELAVICLGAIDPALLKSGKPADRFITEEALDALPDDAELGDLFDASSIFGRGRKPAPTAAARYQMNGEVKDGHLETLGSTRRFVGMSEHPLVEAAAFEAKAIEDKIRLRKAEARAKRNGVASREIDALALIAARASHYEISSVVNGMAAMIRARAIELKRKG